MCVSPRVLPLWQAAQGPHWGQEHSRQQHTTSVLPLQPLRVLQQHPPQHLGLQQLQLRHFSVDSEVSRQRLIAAHQRRAREQEALQRRKAAEAAAPGAAEASSSSSSSAELQEHVGSSSVAVVPQESPPADVQVKACSMSCYSAVLMLLQKACEACQLAVTHACMVYAC